ncbi:Protein CBG08995 [Caenorhabditis briggsae]|uniref:ARF7 effector protein C-terminal domain-containing protein n=2 Tax=Caenorhabditis briggsae TaxID=6238 RepID=A0AAE9DA44_CAEBR|nr:Protein CBG08995 [Caenorhabditis briggsae]ULT99624.1 hypothetical protein L3Y34_000726 [Caenorhabditis briggsae]CAP28782.1 Protein CBG08995 [Caenorhabditis briggsae]
MNANEMLAQIAGISVQTEVTKQTEVYDDHAHYEEEISYDDLDPEPYETIAREATPPDNSRRRPGRVAQRELEGLQFQNPGGKIAKPDTSDIYNTNRARRNHVNLSKQQQMQEVKEKALHHDANGKLSSTVRGETSVIDLCDCLDAKCDGCQWPCKTCSSRKCLIGCRTNRREMAAKCEEMFTVEGASSHVVAVNAYFPIQIKD